MDRNLKVLLIGHACSPYRGSELAFTWNWAWHLAQQYQVWVITHPQERDAITSFLAEHPNPNLHFVWVTPPRWIDPWKPATGDRGIRLHYTLWQRAAMRTALRLHREITFDLAHHVSWGTVSEPPLVSRIPIPFVWGPVGGGQIVPPGFRKYFGAASRSELIRSVRVRLAAYRPAVRSAARRSALTLATNRETARILKLAGARNLQMFLDSGIRDDFLSREAPRRASSPQLTLLWVGILEARKCLPFALHALAQLSDLPLRLLVAGKGPLREEWENLAAQMGLSKRVVFLGQIPYGDMPALYRSADAFLFTSLRDSFGSQVLEAMAAGLPVLTLDHQGVGAFVPGDAGIKVPVTDPDDVIFGLSRAIRAVAGSAELRTRMGQAAWRFAKTQTWTQRANQMGELYQGVITNVSATGSTSAAINPPLRYFAVTDCSRRQRRN